MFCHFDNHTYVSLLAELDFVTNCFRFRHQANQSTSDCENSDSQSLTLNNHTERVKTSEVIAQWCIYGPSYIENLVDDVLSLANHFLYEFNPAPEPVSDGTSESKTENLNIKVQEICEYLDKKTEFGCDNLSIPSRSHANFESSDEIKYVKKRCVGTTEAENETLKGYKFKYRYLTNCTRRKRVIVWMYDKCNHEFKKTWNFLDHARMHLGEKPYSCNLWDLTFTQRGNMIKHIRLHKVRMNAPKKPYQCELWHRSYTEKYNLKVGSLSMQVLAQLVSLFKN